MKRVWAILLGLGGSLAIVLGLWRLYVWHFGAPQDLFDLPAATWELSPERIDERIAAQKRSIEKARTADLDVKSREQVLQELQEGREEWVAQWDRAVARARWKELRNGLVLLLLAGILLSAGWRKLRPG